MRPHRSEGVNGVFEVDGRSRATLVGRLAFAAAIAAELALVFVPKYFVTVDGAFHVSVAALLRDIIQGHGTVAFHYFEWHLVPVPNLLPDLALTGLMLVFDPGFSEKLLIAGYIVGLPLALRYAVRAVRPENAWLGFLALPLTFSFPFNYGFYNFSYSVILFLVVAGYALRHRGELDGRRAGILTGLLLLTYFTHIVGFLEAALFVGVVFVTDWVSDWRGRRSGQWLRRRLPLALAVFVPSTCLAAWFFLTTTTGVPTYYESQWRMRAEFFALSWGVTSYSRYEVLWTLLVAVLLAVLILGVVRVRGRPRLRLRVTEAPLLFAFIASLAFAEAPFQVKSGGSFITQRLALFPIYGVVLWIAAYRLSRRSAIWAAAVALIAALGLGLTRLPTYRKLNSVETDFMAVEPCLARDSTMVQASMALALPGSDVRLDPLTADAGRLAANLHGVDLGSIEGSVPFYVLQFRPSLDPYKQLVVPGQYIEGIPPPLDPLGYERRTPAGAGSTTCSCSGSVAPAQRHFIRRSGRRSDASSSPATNSSRSLPTAGSRCGNAAGRLRRSPVEGGVWRQRPPCAHLVEA